MFALNPPVKFPKFILLLISVLLLAGSLRFWDLPHLPSGLHWDEQDTGYQAYSLIQTGKDYFGRPLPLIFHSLADWRTPVFIYSTVPFVKLFGLSAFAVRFPSALAGVISVLLIFYLGSLLFNPKVGLLASLTLALSVWHVLYAHQSVECNIMLMYLLLGLVAFYKKWLPISALGFALAIASYSPAKMFVPLLVLFLYIVHRPKFHFPSAIIFSVIAIPILWSSTFGPAGTRFHDLSILTDPTVPSEVNQKRLESDLAGGATRTLGMQPKILTKLVYNKFTLPFGTFISNYYNTYSAQYLFTVGDTNLRQSPSKDSIGQLYLIEVLPLLLGLFFLASNIKHPSAKLLFFWFIIGPIPSALTRDGGPHAARTFLLLPAFALTIAYGLTHFKKYVYIYLVLLLISSVFAFQYFFTTYRFEGAKPFQWGFDQVVATAVDASSHYDRVFVDLRDDTALMAYLFYTHYSPAKFQSQQPFPQSKPLPDITSTQFGNIYLLNPGVRFWTNIHITGTNVIIATSDQPLLDKYSPKSTILYPDSTPAFYIFSR